jgi:hypothetical protein
MITKAADPARAARPTRRTALPICILAQAFRSTAPSPPRRPRRRPVAAPSMPRRPEPPRRSRPCRRRNSRRPPPGSRRPTQTEQRLVGPSIRVPCRPGTRCGTRTTSVAAHGHGGELDAVEGVDHLPALLVEARQVVEAGCRAIWIRSSWSLKALGDRHRTRLQRGDIGTCVNQDGCWPTRSPWPRRPGSRRPRSAGSWSSRLKLHGWSHSKRWMISAPSSTSASRRSPSFLAPSQADHRHALKWSGPSRSSPATLALQSVSIARCGPRRVPVPVPTR